MVEVFRTRVVEETGARDAVNKFDIFRLATGPNIREHLRHFLDVQTLWSAERASDRAQQGPAKPHPERLTPRRKPAAKATSA